jgi:hypothetical protein
MKSIKRRFKKIEKKNPYWSSYECFWNSVRGQGFGKKMISIWFNELVNKDDYAKSEKKQIITQLIECSNEPYEGKK